MSKMVRMNDEASRLLDDVAIIADKSKQDLMTEAFKLMHRKYFFEKVNRELEELKKDPKAWKAYQAEHEIWDVTLLDGLEEES